MPDAETGTAVGRNARLDDFDAGAEDTDVDPIEPVQRWDPAPTACARCGDATSERWTDGSVTGVCTDCKDW